MASIKSLSSPVTMQEDASRRARKTAKQGITLAAHNEEIDYLFDLPREDRNGRPPSNIFEIRAKRLGVEDSPDLHDQRKEMSQTFVRWRNKYQRLIGNPKYRLPSFFRVPSLLALDRKDTDWTVWRAGELAEILCGRRTPEEREHRKSYQATKEPLANEIYLFWYYLHVHIECRALEKRGPKPNVEKYFKAAVSAYIVRNFMLKGQGGNSRVKLSPLHVSQIWFVLFGEYERPDNIKKILPKLVVPCRQFGKQSRGFRFSNPRHFPSLGKTLEYQFKSN